jgi:hypothetical protein
MSVSTTTRRTVLAGLAASAVLAGQQRAADENVLRFQFKDGSQRWLPGLSDYSADASRLNFTAEIRQVPPNYPAELRAYYLESHNTPDDLFMFLKRELSTLDGVETNRDYSVSIHVGFFSNVTDGGVGIGGSPGSDVYLKAGVSLAEPIAVLQDRARYVGLSVDKGQQAQSGSDIQILSTIENGQPPAEGAQPYVFLERVLHFPRLVRTDDRGALWITVGIESGFEGVTGIYFYEIIVTLRPR